MSGSKLSELISIFGVAVLTATFHLAEAVSNNEVHTPLLEMWDGGATRPSPRPPLSVPTTTEPSVVSIREIGVNGMWFWLFWTFVVDFFCDFSQFQAFFTCLDALGSSRNTGEHWEGWVGISNPLKWCVNSIFWPFSTYFPFFFAILCDFHVFECTWKP